MEVGSYLVAGPQAFELVEPGEGALDDPAGLAQAGPVGGALAGDLRRCRAHGGAAGTCRSRSRGRRTAAVDGNGACLSDRECGVSRPAEA